MALPGLAATSGAGVATHLRRWWYSMAPDIGAAQHRDFRGREVGQSSLLSIGLCIMLIHPTLRMQSWGFVIGSLLFALGSAPWISTAMGAAASAGRTEVGARAAHAGVSRFSPSGSDVIW